MLRRRDYALAAAIVVLVSALVACIAGAFVAAVEMEKLSRGAGWSIATLALAVLALAVLEVVAVWRVPRSERRDHDGGAS